MLWLTEDQCSRSSNDVRFRPIADVDAVAKPTTRSGSTSAC